MIRAIILMYFAVRKDSFQYVLGSLSEEIVSASAINDLKNYLKNVYAIKKSLARNKIKNGEKIKVLFLVVHPSVWKLKDLYWQMTDSKIFEPLIAIIPNIVHSKDKAKDELKEHVIFFKNCGYKVVNTYNEINNNYIDVKETLKPDIVFFTNPYPLSHPLYHINNFLCILTCYMPYGIMTANIQKSQFNQEIHNYAWKLFYETPAQVDMAKKYAYNEGENVILTGYPLLDEIFKNDYEPKNFWKTQTSVKKKIIWAPHHTLENNTNVLAYSCFLEISDFMLKLAKKYKEQIQIAFKPHPILKSKLYAIWGEAKTNEYYSEWESLKNGQLEENDYIDLFLTSDAMIMDSISFMSEYMATGKPSLFTVKDETIKYKFNEYGMLCYDMLYKTKSLKNDIIDFIKNVVINEKDCMKEARLNFIESYLKPPNSKTATQNIYDYLLKEIVG